MQDVKGAITIDDIKCRNWYPVNWKIQLFLRVFRGTRGRTAPCRRRLQCDSTGYCGNRIHKRCRNKFRARRRGTRYAMARPRRWNHFCMASGVHVRVW